MHLIDVSEVLFLVGAEDTFVVRIMVALIELVVGCTHEESSAMVDSMFEVEPGDDDLL